jgi:heme oxygenase
VFTFIHRDSWKRRSNVNLPLKINYLSHIYLQLLFLENVMIVNYAARLPYKLPDPSFLRRNDLVS